MLHPDFEIRLISNTVPSDTLGFLALAKRDWDLLREHVGAKADEAFLALDFATPRFGDLMPKKLPLLKTVDPGKQAAYAPQLKRMADKFTQWIAKGRTMEKARESVEKKLLACEGKTGQELAQCRDFLCSAVHFFGVSAAEHSIVAFQGSPKSARRTDLLDVSVAAKTVSAMGKILQSLYDIRQAEGNDSIETMSTHSYPGMIMSWAYWSMRCPAVAQALREIIDLIHDREEYFCLKDGYFADRPLENFLLGKLSGPCSAPYRPLPQWIEKVGLKKAVMDSLAYHYSRVNYREPSRGPALQFHSPWDYFPVEVWWLVAQSGESPAWLDQHFKVPVIDMQAPLDFQAIINGIPGAINVLTYGKELFERELKRTPLFAAFIPSA